MLFRIAPFLLLGLGIFILVQAVMPLLTYKFWELTEYQKNIALLSPSPSSRVLGVSIKNIESFPAFISDKGKRSNLPYEEFTVTIPSLQLEKVKTMVETNDFENNLAHFPGSALPGEKGNVFITGHSSLPQLFKPGNFKAIFANLPKIKKGDEVIVEAGGQKFVYKVEGMKVVSPEETWVINSPDQTGRYLTLMTCVPPGLYLKRLVVFATLI